MHQAAESKGLSLQQSRCRNIIRPTPSAPPKLCTTDHRGHFQHLALTRFHKILCKHKNEYADRRGVKIKILTTWRISRTRPPDPRPLLSQPSVRKILQTLYQTKPLEQLILDHSSKSCFAESPRLQALLGESFWGLLDSDQVTHSRSLQVTVTLIFMFASKNLSGAWSAVSCPRSTSMRQKFRVSYVNSNCSRTTQSFAGHPTPFRSI